MGDEGKGGKPFCACEEGLSVSVCHSQVYKRNVDSSKTCSDIVSYEGGLPPIGNIVLEGSPPPSSRTRSSKQPTAGKPKPSTPRPSIDAPPSSMTRSNKRKTFPPPPSAEESMLSLALLLLYFFLIHGAFPWPTPHAYLFLSPFLYIFSLSLLGNLSTRRTLPPPNPSYLTSSSWRYIAPLHAFLLPCVTMCSPSLFIIIHHFFFACLFFCS